MDNPNKSKIWGPGMWLSIHITALKMGEDYFLRWIRVLIPSIPCQTCREHAIKYLSSNQPESYKGIHNNTGDIIGMFKWSWIFHNDVNKRLNKPILDYNTAYRMYTDESILCSEDCGN